MEVVRKMVSVEAGSMLTSCLFLLDDLPKTESKSGSSTQCDSIIVADALATTLYSLASRSATRLQGEIGTDVVRQISSIGAWHLIDARLKDTKIRLCK